MAALEALSYGKLLIATDTLKMFGVKDSPILDSKTPEDVENNLKRLLNPNFYKEISEKSVKTAKKLFFCRK